MTEPRPLLAHVLFRFAVGGLENGVVNLINHLPTGRYRHVIICVTDHDPEFARRLQRSDVQIFELKKQPGLDLAVWWRLYKLLRQLQPDLIHTRNLSALEALLPSWLAGVPARLHSEHGRDVGDLDGRNKRYQMLRRWLLPLAQTVVALSQDLGGYLRDSVGIASDKVRVICNGVDCDRFTPANTGQRDEVLRFISVGRLQDVKDPLNVLRAFAAIRQLRPQQPMQLELVGDGPLLDACRQFVEALGLRDCVQLPGAASDVAQRLRHADVFLLGSRAEGISNTVLEAMASGLPVVATRVGGNAELVVDGETGFLVPAEQPEALAAALRRYVDDRALLGRHGVAARARAVAEFSLAGMMERYQALYDQLLAAHPKGI
ncbi:TIGR03088 family PEP-CTERM/XrtA system glycosyltransferase [Permianibacter sp. IMCC34836]|uniref:TIGR03088 family PEP-CTERM/XrtA system glycosyltransferase n=1 Tax=Permianibacter fluminis TaxID=2738515 RepID=UPI001556B59F|nr:TIGR03088 family PEP-CTERM/XrtA system glycosyltransferase [Permianibacter fluminis]NQD35588.1 TIGR03088 family PEP-CTERM/XrtA system glycosyltransferase [Permianibacter fluminis]